AGVHGSPRAAVRVLHRRHPDGGRRLPRAARRADSRAGTGPALRSSLQVHGVPAHRGSDPERLPGGKRMNLALSLLYASERHPAAEAVVDGEERLTYRELCGRAARPAGPKACPAPTAPTAPPASRRRFSRDTASATARSASCPSTTPWASTR